MLYNQETSLDPWDQVAREAFYGSGGKSADYDMNFVLREQLSDGCPVVPGPSEMSLENQWETIEAMMEAGLIPKVD